MGRTVACSLRSVPYNGNRTPAGLILAGEPLSSKLNKKIRCLSVPLNDIQAFSDLTPLSAGQRHLSVTNHC